MNIHYNKTTGEIHSWGSVDCEGGVSYLDGCLVINKEVAFIDPQVDRIDPASLLLVKKSAEEIARELLPTLLQLQDATARELAATDKYMMPDFPVLPQEQAAWTTYRKALRDLSKGDPKPTVAEMIAAWPLDPKGNDALVILRARQNKGKQ